MPSCFLCSFPVWCLGKEVEFVCIGSLSLPFYLLCYVSFLFWLLFWLLDYCTEHQWKVTNDSRTLNKGALLVLSEQLTAAISAFIFVVYSPMYRYYRKWYSSWMNAWHPFVYEHQLFSFVSMGNCKDVVLPENLSLAFSIWWNNRNHFDGVFMEYLSGIQPHVYFENNVFKFWKATKSTKCTCSSCSILTRLAVRFLWLSLPGHNRVTDEALLAETT